MKKILSVALVAMFGFANVGLADTQQGKALGNFEVTAKDIQITPVAKKEHTYTCTVTAPEIIFKAVNGASPESVSAEKFCAQWHKKQSFAVTPPNARIAFIDDQGTQYQAFLKLDMAKAVEAGKEVQEGIEFMAATYDPKEKFLANGQPVKYEDFHAALKGKNDQGFVIMIDNSPFDPR